MLKQLRNKKTAKKIWITLAIIVVPAFVLWGLGGALRSQKESGFAGTILGRRITNLEYKDAYDAVKTQAIMRFGDKLPEVEKNLNLEYQAWIRITLLTEAKNRKLTVSDKDVIESIQDSPLFQYKGQFDNKNYVNAVHYVFHTQPRIFEEQMRQNLIITKLYDQVTAGIHVTKEEIEKAYRQNNEELSLYYIVSCPADFKKDINPPEGAMKDYFSKNSLEFKQPLSFNLEYVAASSEMQAKNIILLLNKNNDFNKIAKDSGLAVKETGLFTQVDPIPGIGWSPEIIDQISKLRVGQVVGPIKTDKFYVLRLKEKKEAYIPDYEKVKDRVKDVVIKAESERIAQEKIQGCQNKLKELFLKNPKSADFASCAKEFGLKSDATANFKFGSYIEGIGASDLLWNTAQKLKDDELSDPIYMPSGFYIIKLKSKTPIDQKKFESEKADFTQKLLLQKKEASFSRFLEGLNTKIIQ